MNVGQGGTSEEATPKKRSYTSRSCSFCARRHIKCTGLQPCANCSFRKTANNIRAKTNPGKAGRVGFLSANGLQVCQQRRGIRCEYTEKLTKRGPKPGTTRDATKQKLKQEQMAKIVEELERQRQLSEYWRNKYIDIHSFTVSVVKDPQTRLLVEESLGSDSTPLLSANNSSMQPRNLLILDAVASFLSHVNLSLPNVFVPDQEKIIEWFVYDITPSQLCEPFDSFVPEKMAEGALSSSVFAHGWRLRSNEDIAQGFANKADMMLKEILVGNHGGITSPTMMAFHGASGHHDNLKWLLDSSLRVLTNFKGSIDPLISQRVYLQVVTTRTTTPADRWALWESALAMDQQCAQSLCVQPHMPGQERIIIREAFFLSNKATMCFAFSTTLDWLPIDDAGPFKLSPAVNVPAFSKYLDETEQAIAAYEAYSRAAPNVQQIPDLLNAYRVILASARAGLYLGSGIDGYLLYINKAFEAMRAIPLSNSPPFITSTYSFIAVLKMAKYLKQQQLVEEGAAMVSAMAKYYPGLLPVAQALVTNTSIAPSFSHLLSNSVKEETSDLLPNMTGLPGLHTTKVNVNGSSEQKPTSEIVTTSTAHLQQVPHPAPPTARAAAHVTPLLPASSHLHEFFTQFSPVALRPPPGFTLVPTINPAAYMPAYGTPQMPLAQSFAMLDPSHFDPTHQLQAQQLTAAHAAGPTSPSSSSSE